MATKANMSLISKDTSGVNAAKKARARGRWKLLQQALLSSSNSTNTSTDDEDAAQLQHYSKRSFPGYQMLESRILSGSSSMDDSNIEWVQKLQRIDTTAVDIATDKDAARNVRNDIECSILAIHALRTTTTNDQQRRNGVDDDHNRIVLFMDTDPDILLQRIMGGTSWLEELPALHEIVRKVESGAAAATHDDKCGPWCLTFHLYGFETNDQEQSPSRRGGGTATNDRHSRYCVREYRLPVVSGTATSNKLPQRSTIITRERIVSAHTKLSLQELVSHRNNNNNNNQNGGGGVDNTGNICVWDCALTLAWALHQQQQQERQPEKHSVVLELGAGMAAISAFSLAVTAASSSLSAKIYVTDGHADCVQNNRVNVRLLQAVGLVPSSHRNDDDDEGSRKVEIDCRQMLWTTDSPTTSSSPDDAVLLLPLADTMLIADCTHFQEYHAALFWTAVRHTSANGGQIWMCQPKRGNSLERFLELIRVVNDNNNNNNNGNSNSSAAPLLRVTEQHYPVLDAKHQKFLEESSSSSNNHYDPNLHRPRIFVLTKERPENEQDRLCAIRHMQERDQGTAATTS